MNGRWIIAGLLLSACSAPGAALPKSDGEVTPPPADAPPSPSTPASPAPASTALCTTDQAAFDTFVAGLKAELSAAKITGAAVAIVCGDKLFAAGIGQTATSNGQPVTEHTRFNVGSTQKVFTGALAMRLVEEGTITLDDPASKWVTGVNTQAPFARSCTMGELLSHVSGYPAVPADSATSMDLGTFFQQMGQAKLWSEPGAVFNYSNVGFELAGLAMQNAKNEAFGALIESKVFAPAGMVDARMDAAKVVSEGNYATSYASDGAFGPSDMVSATVMGPDTGAWASAADLGHFAQTLLDKGGTMLKPDSVTKMTTARAQTDDPSQKYGIGMFLADLGGTPLWTHSGENGGYVTDLTLVPTRGFASAILVSSEAGAPGAYFKAIETFTRAPLPAPADTSFNDADETDHVGTYQSANAGTVTVAKSGATMTITVGGKTATLTPVFKDGYTFPYAPWGGGNLPVNFARTSGKVTHVVSRAFVAAKM